MKIQKVNHADFGEWFKCEQNGKTAFGRTSLEALNNWMQQFSTTPIIDMRQVKDILEK